MHICRLHGELCVTQDQEDLLHENVLVVEDTQNAMKYAPGT